MLRHLSRHLARLCSTLICMLLVMPTSHARASVEAPEAHAAPGKAASGDIGSNHEALLTSADPIAARNKRLVYDFWREVLEAGHIERAERYLTAEYIQHNPNIASGREAFVAFFSAIVPRTPIQAQVRAPLIAIVAEGDRVIVAFSQPMPEPKDPSRTYTTTWFDMFRIEDGKIAEHWDPALK